MSRHATYFARLARMFAALLANATRHGCYDRMHEVAVPLELAAARGVWILSPPPYYCRHPYIVAFTQRCAVCGWGLWR